MMLLRLLVCLLLLALSACKQGAPPAPAPIASFEAVKDTIDAGGAAQLRWQIAPGLQASIVPAVGAVDGRSSIAVRPAVTTAYTLRVRDSQGRVSEAALTVNVRQALAPEPAHPILFVTQVPLHTDFSARLSAFANHLPGPAQAPRGGDLMLRYPDGSLRNLTREAGFGLDGAEGANAIAVREPSVHWSGERVLFAMVVGSAPVAGVAPVWQLYEASGLAKGQAVRIVKVAGQPPQYNNVSPLYASDDSVLFTSDRPRAGLAQLYPQLDEYEGAPSVSGIWRLDPASGALRLLNHAVSGAFSPSIDSFGRLIFTRWDHQQQDQLAERDRNAVSNGVRPRFASFNYASEAADAARLASRAEPFPESRAGSSGRFGEVSAFTTNFFTAWQMNEDGSGEETLNHVGQHELAFGYLTPSFRDDPALLNHTRDALHANRVPLRREGGLFHLREDPLHPGSYLATAARESESFTTSFLVRLDGGPDRNPEAMTVTELTASDPGDMLAGGRFRNPLALADGRVLASHSASTRAPEPGETLDGLRLTFLTFDRASGRYQAGQPLTPGIVKALHWQGPGGPASFKGALWELEAVELRARARPTRARATLEPPERAVLAEQNVSEAALRAWLEKNALALIVTRNQTSRDRADLQQPFNLQVEGGVKTVSQAAPLAKVYPIAHFQIFQGDQIRAYGDRPGRRVIAQPLHEGPSAARTAAGAPAGSVRIAADGSTAAFVPAGRALTWQTTDGEGNAVVRERNWITFQAGEMRTCASCHGVNTQNQAGQPSPTNQPQALRELLAYWKTLPK